MNRTSRLLPGRAAALRRDYLDLMMGALTHLLYREIDLIDVPKEIQEELYEGLRVAEDNWLLFEPEIARAQGRDWPRHAQTMVGLDRLGNVRRAVETVVRQRIPGDLIEAGCWRGGVGILMRGVLHAYGVRDRTVWLADSFQGLPEPDERFPADAGDRSHAREELRISADEVRDNFRRYGLLDERVRLVEGWFRDTLPALQDRRWAVVRLDGDMYESTMDGLRNLYPGLQPGGFLIIDDYGLEPCREAVHDFRREHGISEEIEKVDWTGVFWRKKGARLRRAPAEAQEKVVEMARGRPRLAAAARALRGSR